MISAIQLHDLLPQVFGGVMSTDPPSEVWGCDLTFERGCSYLIEAASGRGKSSLCSFLYGLRRDYEGLLSFDGVDARTYTQRQWTAVRQRSLALLFQEHRLFGELTAVENCLLKNHLTHFVNEAEVRHRLERVGLSDRCDVPCARLSLGQQQRVAFVRMLCQPADFWLLDEPVSHLDEANGAILAALLREAQAEQGAGVIVTSIGRRLPFDYRHVLCL